MFDPRTAYLNLLEGDKLDVLLKEAQAEAAKADVPAVVGTTKLADRAGDIVADAQRTAAELRKTAQNAEIARAEKAALLDHIVAFSERLN